MKSNIVGVLHIDAFPKNLNKEKIQKIKDKALADLASLQFGGVDSIIFENEFNTKKSPYGEFLTKQQQNIMFDVVSYLKPYVFLPFGFCILLNDFKTALLLAKKFGGGFIRVDTFVDNVERISDGIKIFPDADAMIKFRKDIDAKNVEIWADVHVKHTKLLEKSSLADSIKKSVFKNADRIIITGNWTGIPPTKKDLEEAIKISKNIPIVIGSGINKKNILKYKKFTDTIIIGSAFKENNSVDINKVQAIVQKNINSQKLNTLLVSSFSFDHIDNQGQKTISPGGPAYFISNVFKAKKLSYNLATSNITKVNEKIINGESVGSDVEVPKLILPKNLNYKNIVISTQLQEFNLGKLVDAKANIYLDLQGYVSDEKFGEMKNLKLKKEIWEKLSYVKCNQKELKYLPENFVEYIKNNKVFIITKGSNGVEYYFKGKKYFIQSEPVVKIKDTLGAGDTFFANFVYYNICFKNIRMAITKAMKNTEIFLQNK
jgi:membrane complex biogenesis BtpA family protein